MKPTANRDDAAYLISDVSQRVGLSQKRIRDYEKSGLIRPKREARTNNRRYSEADIKQILHIKTLIHEHGFTVACLRNFLAQAPCWVIFNCGRKETCPTYKNAAVPCYEMMKKASHQSGPRDCYNCPVYLNRNVEKIVLLSRP